MHKQVLKNSALMKCKNYHQPVVTFMVCVLLHWNWCGAYPIQVQVAMTEHFKRAKEYLLHLFSTPETLKGMRSKFLASCNATLSSSGEEYNERAVYPHILISRVTPRSHNQDPEYCLLSEEHNPVLRNPQQTLLFCTFCRPPVLQDVHYKKES